MTATAVFLFRSDNMSDVYRHGVYSQEIATALTPMIKVVNPIVAIGTAKQGAPNEPVLCYSRQEYVTAFGYEGDYSKYTLDEVADVCFTLYNVAPVIFINVYDPTIHNKVVDEETVGDVTKVTATDITALGNVSDKKKGLELLEEIYPRFGLIPGTIIAPGWSGDVIVAATMAAKVQNINGCFQAMAVVDQDPAIAGYSNAATAKSVTNSRVILCWPRVTLGGKVYHLSTHVAALMARVDAAHDDLPYKSPSNETLQIDGAKEPNGADVWLTKEQANLLNGRGIVTALRFAGAFRSWGNRTSLYDYSGSTTDPKDTFIPVRRMINWLINTLTVSYFSRIDEPISKRQVESIVNEVQIYFNGLVARGALVGGSIVFLEDENPVTDLSDGIVRFHIQVCPPSPMRELTFVIEYQPKFYSSLFD